MKLNKVFYDPNFSISLRNTYITDVLPSWLGYFEKLAPTFDQESNNTFFIGDRLTWIDYIIFELLDMNVEFAKGTRSFLTGPNVEQDILKDFPKLKYFYENFYQRPKLQKYLLSANRLPFKLPYRPQAAVVDSKTS